MAGMEQIEKDIRDLVDIHKALASVAILKAALAARGHKQAFEKQLADPTEGGDAVKLFVPILKLSVDKQELTGVVLQPEVVDAQGDIMSAEVIEKAAGNFLASFNTSNTLGLMHTDFKKRFELRQSFIAPGDIVIGGKIVKAGSWVITVKVLDFAIWKKIKSGELTGFSIGGKAKVKVLAA